MTMMLGWPRCWHIGVVALEIDYLHVLVVHTVLLPLAYYKSTRTGTIINIHFKPALTNNTANSNTISNLLKFSSWLQRLSHQKFKSLYLEIWLVQWRPNTFSYHSIFIEPFITSSIHGKHWRIFLNCILILLQSHIVVALVMSLHALTTAVDVVACSLESLLQINWTEAKHPC
jgi:hypothetical protein